MTTTVTATDVHLAKTYFGVLVEVAKQQKEATTTRKLKNPATNNPQLKKKKIV